MSNKRPLKAYVRYDGSGRAVSSSLIWRKNKPKVGNWKEVQGYECCNPPACSEIFIPLQLRYGVVECDFGSPETYYLRACNGNIQLSSSVSAFVPVPDGYYTDTDLIWVYVENSIVVAPTEVCA
jgi:hypothetical protein